MNSQYESPETGPDTPVSSPDTKHPSAWRRYGPSLLLLLAVFVICFIIVKKFKNPMQMTLLQSGEAMDMASMGGQTGYLPVELIKVDTGSVRSSRVYSATVVPYSEQMINPRVTGRIIEIPVYPGDKVKPGQLLVRLDSDELSSQLAESQYESKSAQTEVLKSKKELEAAQSRKTGAEAELKMANADYKYWQEEIARQKKLYTNGAISKDEYQMSQSQFQSAKARHEKALAMVQESENMLEAARLSQSISQNMAQQGKAKEKTARIVRDYTTLRSPIKGYVSERLISPGTLVEPGMTILKLVESDRVRVQANLPSSALTDVKAGNPVLIRLHDPKISPISTKISAVFPSADPLARTVIVEAVVSNPGNSLKPGDFVSMEVTGATHEEAIRIPQTALFRLDSEDTSYVWVYQSSKEAPSKPMEMSHSSHNSMEMNDSSMKGMEDSSMESMPGHKMDMTSEKKSPALAVQYTCPMHPEVISDKPGICPKCGMTLVRKKTEEMPMEEMKPEKPANLPSGAGVAVLRKVAPGISDGTYVEILEGLEAGEIVIFNGGKGLHDGDKVYPVPYGKEGAPLQLPPPPPMKPGSMNHAM